MALRVFDGFPFNFSINLDGIQTLRDGKLVDFGTDFQNNLKLTLHC